ncbi:T-cell-interacting, activating receptor on myeloid cells protein 1 isoform X5 [Moschus berezovskii]|uniref:T-cell-interacting, activating receptor on myeloid cells protein 1 isoform X5 n=1 Tax=Moschus berezovskii TaxID=68408 RepID=UPI002443E20A|nr:T-cell-interacting, activating receptor on myeloid cells protein 1 isoform X5 [Moschus berezovskii]
MHGFQMLFPHWLFQDIEKSSLCCSVRPCRLLYVQRCDPAHPKLMIYPSLSFTFGPRKFACYVRGARSPAAAQPEGERRVKLGVAQVGGKGERLGEFRRAEKGPGALRGLCVGQADGGRAGYLRRPSLQAHRRGAVTEGHEVTLQCQRPATERGTALFALLKAGSAAPVQVRAPAGRETDLSLRNVRAGDSGSYSCVHCQARAPFLASQASPRLESRVAASPPSISSDYSTGSHIRLALAAR